MTFSRLEQSWISRPRLIGSIVVGCLALFLIRPGTLKKPQRTLRMTDAVIVGITDDGSHLLTLTRRAVPQSFNRDSRTTSHVESVSGPLQIWDLGRGLRRDICIPGQECSTPRVPTSSGMWMQDVKGMRIDVARYPIVGNWFHCKRSVGQLYGSPLLVNLRSGDVRASRDGSSIPSMMSSSPGGHWIAQRLAGTEPPMLAHLEVHDANTDRVHFRSGEAEDVREWCFSNDDLWCAYVGTNTDTGRDGLNVIRVGTGERWRLHQERCRAVSFSPSCKAIACIRSEADKTSLAIVDVTTHHVKKEIALESVDFVGDRTDSTRLTFSDDGTWLVYSSGWNNTYEGADAAHCGLNIKVIWNVVTGERVECPNDRWDPRISRNGLLPQRLPPLVCDNNNRVYDTFSGRVKAVLPVSADPIEVLGGGRFIIFEDERESVQQRALQALIDARIPVPNKLWDFLDRKERAWMVLDLESDQICESMPVQQKVHWLSADGRILVTQDDNDNQIVRVWDTVPRIRSSGYVVKAVGAIMSGWIYFYLVGAILRIRGRRVRKGRCVGAVDGIV